MGGFCSSVEAQDRNTLDTERQTEEKAPPREEGLTGMTVDFLSQQIWGNPKKGASDFFKKKKTNSFWVKAFAAICVQQGGLTPSQRQYILERSAKFYPDVDCSTILTEIESTKDVTQQLTTILSELKKQYKNPSITIFPEYEKFRDSVAEYLLFMYLSATARITLDDIDVGIAVDAALPLGVEPDVAEAVYNLLLKEAVIYDALDAIHLDGEDVDTEAKEVSVEEPYLGNVGYAIESYTLKKLKVSAKDQVSELMTDYNRFMSSYMSLVAIVAKGDGELSEIEERKLKAILHRVVENPDEAAVIGSEMESFETHMEVVREGLEEIRPLVAIGQYGLLLAAWPDHLGLSLTRTSIVVAAQDGLVHGEVDVVSDVAERLSVNKSVVQKFAFVLLLEKELCVKFYETMMTRR